jgi:ribosomal protein L37E
MPANPVRRKLFSPHPGVLDHGDGRFWCLDCHDADNRNELHTPAGEKVSFNQTDQVCSSCHYQVHRDWTFGAHGKRVANWQGERTVYSCAHCHNPHQPRVRPRSPEGPPPVRAGLAPMPANEGHPRVYPWLQKEKEGEHE